MPACPTCKQPTARPGNDWFPFCRERCKLVDLGRWIDGEYRVPVEDSTPPAEPPEDGDPEAD